MKTRLCGHMTGACPNASLGKWLSSLADKNLVSEMCPLELASRSEASERERYWQEAFAGPLLLNRSKSTHTRDLKPDECRANGVQVEVSADTRARIEKIRLSRGWTVKETIRRMADEFPVK